MVAMARFLTGTYHRIEPLFLGGSQSTSSTPKNVRSLTLDRWDHSGGQTIRGVVRSRLRVPISRPLLPVPSL